MVHLTKVHRETSPPESLLKRVDTLQLDDAEENNFSASVYGTRFAIEKLPENEMPDREMPRDVAYRMIKDELSLDGNPMLNLASFVTTYMVGTLLSLIYGLELC